MAKIRNRYNQVPRLTQDTTWESVTNTIKHHKQEPRGQPFPNRGPQGSNEQTRKHDQPQNINNTNDPQKKYRPGKVSKNILLEGLRQIYPTELQLYKANS